VILSLNTEINSGIPLGGSLEIGSLCLFFDMCLVPTLPSPEFTRLGMPTNISR
jgi:hypothetical protein